MLTHWGRVVHICVSKLTIIGSDHGLSPGRRQAMIWTNAGILLIGTSGTNFSEIFIEIHTFSFKKIHLKMSFRKWCPFCRGLNMWNLDFAEHYHIHVAVTLLYWLQLHPAKALLKLGYGSVTILYFLSDKLSWHSMVLKLSKPCW